MRSRESRQDLLLAVEALCALVDDAYPAAPLADLARGLSTYGHTPLTDAHYGALAKVEQSFLNRPKPVLGGGYDAF